MKDIRSLVIVECPENLNTPLVSFNGCEIVTDEKLILDSNETVMVDVNGKADLRGTTEEPITEMTKDIFQQKLLEKNENAPDGKI